MQATRPPESEAELMRNAASVAGLTLAELACVLKRALPGDPRRSKGFIGQLLELALGASAGSLPEPDFQRIGVELKTVPVNTAGQPAESTYVCTVPLEPDGSTSRWSTSNVRIKLNRVLWVPVEADTTLDLGQRRIGNPVLWSPDQDEDQALRADWEELMDLVLTGRVAEITAHQGTCLQIRPKAADSKARRWGIGEDGQRVRTLPRGFYLRPSFTGSILKSRYAGL